MIFLNIEPHYSTDKYYLSRRRFVPKCFITIRDAIVLLSKPRSPVTMATSLLATVGGDFGDLRG